MGNLEIVYHDIALGAAKGATVTTEGNGAFSQPQSLLSGKKDFRIMATLEKNQWVLDETRLMFEPDSTVTFWSANISDADGKFSAPPTMTFNLDKLYTSVGLQIVFGGDDADFCSEIKVTWFSGDNIILSKVYHPDGKTYHCNDIVENYNKVKVELIKTAIPKRYAKVNNIFFGAIRTYGRSQIRRAEYQVEGDPISNTVAVSTLDWDLNPIDKTEFIFQSKQPVYIYDGDDLLGITYITKSERKEEQLYSVNNVDIIGLLDEGTFPATKFDNVPLRTALNELLKNNYPIYMDEELESETITGYIEECSRREALRQICFSVQAYVTSFRTDGLRVGRISAPVARYTDKNDIFMGQSVSDGDVITRIELVAHNLVEDPDGDIEIGDQKYRDDEVTKSKINPDILPGEKDKVYNIDDMTLVNLSNVDKILDSTYNYLMSRKELSAKVVLGLHDIGEVTSIPSPWGTELEGAISSMSIHLSNLTVADMKVRAK